jgi:nucleotide-binding universal stress UspA family protein
MAESRIVVGVDGSPASRAALEWAVAEARLRHATLEVVHAWEFPAFVLTTYGGATLPVVAPEDLERAARELVARTVAGMAGADPVLRLETTVVRGHPANTLVEAAKGADLLVVGSRGHGGFTGMLLGSVSNHVAHHATCPVVIVRHRGPA